MRKVIFKKWDSVTRKWEDDFTHNGSFHKWSIASEEYQHGVGNYTVGIIELPTGEVVEVLPSNIKFIS